jgi:hypothetical protein
MGKGTPFSAGSLARHQRSSPQALPPLNDATAASCSFSTRNVSLLAALAGCTIEYCVTPTVGSRVRLFTGLPTPAQGLAYCPSAMRKKLTPQQISSVPCPICGVQPQEKCQLNTGQPRNNPHRDRRLFAADKLNSRYNVHSQAQTSRRISITSGLVKRVAFERIKARLLGDA